MLAISIIGGRPNLIKTEPVHKGLIDAGINHLLVDVGVFRKEYGARTYSELGLPNPIVLNPVIETDDYLKDFKKFANNYQEVFQEFKPDVVLVYGDLNPGFSASVAASVCNIPIAHVESGLRNYDIDDTEEINRLTIDRFSKIHFAISHSSYNNLVREKFNKRNICLSGNPITNALSAHLPFAETSLLDKFSLKPKQYGLITIHRDENLRNSSKLRKILEIIQGVQLEIPLVFIQYSSTLKAIHHLDKTDFDKLKNVTLLNTVSYHDYLGLLNNTAFVFTDSSGLQDETSFLGIPCFTCRENNHRPDTLLGTNKLVGPDSKKTVKLIISSAQNIGQTNPSYPKEWDFNVGRRISKKLIQHFG